MRPTMSSLQCLVLALLVIPPLLAAIYIIASFPYPPAPLTILPSLSSLPIAWSIYPDDYYAGGAYAPLPFGKVRYWLLGPEKGQKVRLHYVPVTALPRDLTRRTQVILIHGLSIPAIIWRDVAPTLAANGHRVLLYDLYGRGYSDAPQTKYDTNLYTTQLALLMQYLKWDKAIVAGVSMGGGIAAAFTSQYPYLVDDRVVLIASAGVMESGDISRTAKFMSSPFVQSLASSSLARKYLQRLANTTSSSDTSDHDLIPDANTANFKEIYNGTSPSDPIVELVRLQSAHLPGYNAALSSSLRHGPIRGQARYFSSPSFDSRRVLLVHGTDDQTVPSRYSSKILSLLPPSTRAKSEVITVEGAGHDLTLSHSPLINELLADFFKGRRLNSKNYQSRQGR
ncbi:Alpha/Beta hydrolase protein [Amanita rubescens]|nr:Alpha/Beta hydrolase protein [Amanita rubescens]